MADIELTQQQPSNEVAKKRKPKKHLSRKASSGLFVALMLLLPLAQFALFWVVPNFNSILMGFKTQSGNSFTTLHFETFWYDLTNTESLQHTSLIWAIINSLIYFAVNIFICTPLVLFFSYVLFRKVPLSKMFRVVFYLPSILGITVTATLFMFLFKPGINGRPGGPFWELLISWGVITRESQSLFTNPSTAFIMVIAYSIWTCVGLNMIMFNGAMKRIPSEVFESADLDGVGFFRQFISIVIPLIWPTISTLIIFSLSGIFVSYGATMILTSGVNESSMIGWYILQFVEGINGRPKNPNYAAAVGLVFTVIGLPFILIIKKGLDKIGSNVEY